MASTTMPADQNILTETVLCECTNRPGGFNLNVRSSRLPLRKRIVDGYSSCEDCPICSEVECPVNPLRLLHALLGLSAYLLSYEG